MKSAFIWKKQRNQTEDLFLVSVINAVFPLGNLGIFLGVRRVHRAVFTGNHNMKCYSCRSKADKGVICFTCSDIIDEHLKDFRNEGVLESDWYYCDRCDKFGKLTFNFNGVGGCNWFCEECAAESTEK